MSTLIYWGICKSKELPEYRTGCLHCHVLQLIESRFGIKYCKSNVEDKKNRKKEEACKIYEKSIEAQAWKSIIIRYCRERRTSAAH
jgi:hypothetical protein